MSLSATAVSAFTPLNFSTLTNLRSLDLSDNIIGQIGDPNSSNTNVAAQNGDNQVTANVALSNLLGQIDPTPGSETLEVLNISRNPLPDGAGVEHLILHRNVALQEINMSRLGSAATPYTFGDVGIGQAGTAGAMVNLVTLDLSDNPSIIAADVINIVSAGMDVVGTGSLTTLNLSNTGLALINVSPAIAAAPANGLYFSDPTTIDNLILRDSELVEADFDFADGLIMKHSKMLGQLGASPTSPFTTATGARFDTVDLRGSQLTTAGFAAGASVVTFIRNTFLIESTNRPSAQETSLDAIGGVEDGVAIAPVRDATMTGNFFAFQPGVDATKNILIIKPNGGEQFDTRDFGTTATDNTAFQSDAPAITLAAANAGSIYTLDLSTDGGASYTEITGSPFTIVTGSNTPETTNIRFARADLQDANGDDINSSQVLLRASLSTDPNFFDVTDTFMTFNKGSVIQNIFTGLSVSFPNNLFVNPKGAPSTVEVDVIVSNPVGIDSYVLQFRYDPAIFFFASGNVDTTGTASDTFPDPVVAFDNQTGTLTIAAASVNPIPNSPLIPNTLVKFRLNAFSFAQTGVSSDIELVSAVARINDAPVQVSKASVFVVNTFTYGDVNGNGSVGVLDANEILRYAAFAVNSFTGFPNIIRPEFPGAADVNDDGFVGAGDAALVLRFVAGVITSFPADTNLDGIGPDPINPNAVKSIKTQSTKLIAAADGNDLTISLSSITGVNSFRMVLHYDPSAISFSEDDVYWLRDEDITLFTHHDPIKGQITIAGAALKDLAGESADLIKLNFTTLTEIPSTIEIDLSQSFINDGKVQLNAQSSSTINLNGSTGLPSWMIY